MAEGILTALARDLNCLAEENRNTRKRALEKIGDAIVRASPPLEPAVLLEVWDGGLRVPTLRMLSDPIEKNRELALALVSSVLERLPDVRSTLSGLVPTIASRVGLVPCEEPCEELRLALLELAQLVVRRAGHAGAPHCKELAAIACALAADSFPDVKRGVCVLVRDLVDALPADVLALHCAPIARALNANLGHQHAKVRSLTLDALCELLRLDDGPLADLADRFAALAMDASAAVREQCVRRVGELLVRLAEPAAHYRRLLPILLRALTDETPAIRLLALDALNAAGERAAPGARCDRPGVAHVAPPPPASAELPEPFASAPAWPAVQLVQAELSSLMPAALAGLRDWTVGGRLRAAGSLLGTLWLGRGAATGFLDALLPTLYAAVDDDDAAVRAQLAACARMAGSVCEPSALLQLGCAHCCADTLGLAQRSACVLTLGLLLQGMGRADLREHVPLLAATLCRPQLQQQAQTQPHSHADDAAAAAAGVQQPQQRLQLRLASLVRTLLEAAPEACAREPACYRLYCALLQLAAVPGSADSDYAAQRAAMAVLGQELAGALGLPRAAAVHERFAPRLLAQLLAAEPLGAAAEPEEEPQQTQPQPEAPAAGAGAPLIEELGPAQGQGGARAAAAGSARAGAKQAAGADAEASAPYRSWGVGSPGWQLLQALLAQVEGALVASLLLPLFPVLAALLEPSREPALRLTALGLLGGLLAQPGFAQHADFADWAALTLQALLLPNLVWKAGRAAQQVRLAAALCVRSLLLLQPCPLSEAELRESMPAGLPVLRSALEDEQQQTRLAACASLASLLPKVGAGLDAEAVRALYPDLLKRLDDASDAVRLAVCPALEALLRAASYDPHLRKAGANLDETNLSYLLRGLLVHLDDFNPEIQAAAQGVLRAALQVDPAKVCAEISAVRERHRSPKLCDALLAEARSSAAIEV